MIAPPFRPRVRWTKALVLQAWARGFDTLSIAHDLELRESVVCDVIPADQDRRHAERLRAAAHASSRNLEPDHVRL